MKNVITLGKLIGLLLFSLPLLLSINMYTKNTRYELARLVMGTICLVDERAKRARHSQICSIKNRDIYIKIYIVHMSFLPFDP